MSVESGSAASSPEAASEQFRDLLSQISTTLLQTSDAMIDAALETVLGWIGEYGEADRVTLWELAGKKQTLRQLGRWAMEGVAEVPRSLTPRDVPWTASRVLSGRIVRFSEPEELPSEAAVDRQTFQRMGTRSHLSIPLRVGGSTVGVLSLGSLRARRHWSDASVERLHLLGHLIADGLNRRRAHQALSLSEERHRSFVQLSAEGTWCLEFGKPLALDRSEDEVIEELYEQARMVETNDAFARMYGFDTAEEMGLWRLKEFLAPDSSTMTMIRIAHRANYKTSDLQTHERDREGNSKIFLNNINGQIRDGRLLRIWGTQRDVTALRAFEQRTQLQSAILEAFDSGCIVADALAEDMPIVYVNDAFTRITGYSAAEVLGRNCRFLQGDGTDPGSKIAMRDALANSNVFHGEILNYRKDGTPFWNDLQLFPVRDASGTVTQYVGIQSDTTQRRSRAQELEQFKNQLALVARRATMGELTGALAHELNQPLTAIAANTGVAQRLLEAAEPDLREMAAILDDIAADDSRAAQVVHGMRALLTPQEAPWEDLRLAELIHQVTELLRSETIVRRVSLSLDLEADLPEARGDAVQIQQVLVNLILNACEASRDSPAERRRVIVGAAVEGDEELRVFVKDLGPGLGDMPPEELFEPFKTTKADGMGMGLAISRRLVEAHGGRLEGRENPNGGATFRFTLPHTGRQRAKSS